MGGAVGGAAGAKPSIGKLNLQGVADAFERGDIDADERLSKVEKLRLFSKVCSEITPQLFLGADEYAARHAGRARPPPAVCPRTLAQWLWPLARLVHTTEHR